MIVGQAPEKGRPLCYSTDSQAMKMMYDAGGDICQKEAKQVKCPTFILHPGTDFQLLK